MNIEEIRNRPHQQDAMKAAHEYYKTHNRGKMIITKNGTPVARIIPQNQAISYLTDSLTGILKEERELYFRRELERLDRECIYEDGALSASARNIKNLMNTQNIPIETAFAWLNIPETKQQLIKEELKK